MVKKFGRETEEQNINCSVWVETDTGCGFRQKEVAKYTMIHPEHNQTETRAESSLSLAIMCI